MPSANTIALWGSTTPTFTLASVPVVIGPFTVDFTVSGTSAGVVVPAGNFLQLYVYSYGGPRITRYANYPSNLVVPSYVPGSLVCSPSQTHTSFARP